MTNDRQMITIQTFDQFRELCIRQNLNTSQIADLAAKIKMVWVLDSEKYTPDSLLDALAKFHETYFTDDDHSRPIFLDVELNV
jgi:hypothetical protein